MDVPLMQGADFLGTYIKTKLNIEMKPLKKSFISSSEWSFFEFLHADHKHVRFVFAQDCVLYHFSSVLIWTFQQSKKRSWSVCFHHPILQKPPEDSLCTSHTPPAVTNQQHLTRATFTSQRLVLVSPSTYNHACRSFTTPECNYSFSRKHFIEWGKQQNQTDDFSHSNRLNFWL